MAGPAGEAVGVVLLPHRLHRRLLGPHRFVAEGADVCGKKGEGISASVSPTGDEPTLRSWVPPYLWSCPSPDAHSHPATAACLLAPGNIWAASIRQGRRKGPGEQGKVKPCYIYALAGGETEAPGQLHPIVLT